MDNYWLFCYQSTDPESFIECGVDQDHQYSNRLSKLFLWAKTGRLITFYNYSFEVFFSRKSSITNYFFNS